MLHTELYPRGFVFYPESHNDSVALPSPAFERTFLPGGAMLDVHSWADLDIATEGENWVAVVGIGLLYDPLDGTVATNGLARRLLAALLHADGDPAVAEHLLYDMGGRYAVIIRIKEKTYIYHDAHGNRTVYWRTDYGTASSHYDILSRMAPPQPNENPLSDLMLGGRWEHTADAKIRALLPNHRLEIEERMEVRFFPLRENPFTCWGAEKRSLEISRIWRAQMEAVLNLGRPNIMSVTAGTDSRLLMSFVKGHEEKFKAFTYGPSDNTPVKSKFTEILARDIDFSVSLAEVANLNHRVMRFDSDKVKLMDKGTLERNSIHKHGRWILPLYLENFTDPQTLFYRGNLVETARGHNYVAPGADWRPTVETLLMDRSRRLLSEADLTRCRKATRLEMQRLEPDQIHPDYRPEDMAYWEVRMGRFISEVSNETDIAFEVWMPVNHRRILDLFMAYPLHDRYDEAALFEVIDRENPILNSFDLNDQPSMVRRAELFGDEMKRVWAAEGRAPDGAFVRDGQGEIQSVPDGGGLLQLDGESFRRGSEIGRTWNYSLPYGKARLVLSSRWTNQQGFGYMELEAGAGDRVIFRQDLAESSLPQVIDVPDLQTGDTVWVKLRALRNMTSGSWFRASRTEILSYSEEPV